MKIIGYVFTSICLVFQFVYTDMLPTAKPNMIKEEDDVSGVELYKNMKDESIDYKNIHKKFGYRFEHIELFICDIVNHHCDFINNVSIATDNKLDCFHLYTKIYLTVFDVYTQKDVIFHAYIPNQNGSEINQITEIAQDQVVSETCHPILK